MAAKETTKDRERYYILLSKEVLVRLREIALDRDVKLSELVRSALYKLAKRGK